MDLLRQYPLGGPDSKRMQAALEALLYKPMIGRCVSDFDHEHAQRFQGIVDDSQFSGPYLKHLY